MSKALSLAVTVAALLCGPAAQAQNLVDDVKACRQLTDTARRVACYDAMQLPAEPGRPAAAAPKAAPAPAVAAAAVATDTAAKFGQESIKQPAAAAPEAKQIESRIRGTFRGWRPNTQIELENGQVWRIADDSSAFYDLQDPKVTVHRGILGAFYLEIEGVGFQMRVVRVR